MLLGIYIQGFLEMQTYTIFRTIFNLHQLFLIIHVCIWSFEPTRLYWNIIIIYGCEATAKMRFHFNFLFVSRQMDEESPN